jgi:tetratricopeptide (TPR) repeat protein
MLPATAKGDFNHVILLPNRLARCLGMAALLALMATPLAAQTGTGLSVQRVAQDMLKLFQPSATGAYMAGQQALKDLRTDEAARYFADAAQADWDNPILVERAFVALATDGQIGRAASTARRMLELDARNELAELVVATEALKERRYGAAARQLATISQDTFSGITAGILRAWALVGDNRSDEAQALMEELGANGLEDFLVFHRALMAEAAGDDELAIELAARAFEAEPYVARMAEVYARMLANRGDFDAARDVLDAFEAEGLTHPIIETVREAVEAERRPGVFAANVQIGAAEMFHGIGVALSRDGSADLALVFLRLGVYLDPGADVISMALGQLLDGAGQHESANAIYDAIPATSALKPMAVVRVAQNLDATGDRAEAIRRLKNIVATQPDDLDAVSVLGDLLRYDEDYLAAAEAYGQALAITGGESPADWRFYYVRGIAYERAKQWPDAEADFLKALDLNPDQPQVLNYLGYSWVDQGINLEPALEMIEKAVERAPNDGYIIDSLGWAFYRLGRYDEAVQALEQAVQLRPNDPEINDHLGDAYWRAGRRLEARFQWSIAIDVDEEDGNVKARAQAKLASGLEPVPEIAPGEVAANAAE